VGGKSGEQTPQRIPGRKIGTASPLTAAANSGKERHHHQTVDAANELRIGNPVHRRRGQIVAVDVETFTQDRLSFPANGGGCRDLCKSPVFPSGPDLPPDGIHTGALHTVQHGKRISERPRMIPEFVFSGQMSFQSDPVLPAPALQNAEKVPDRQSRTALQIESTHPADLLRDLRQRKKHLINLFDRKSVPAEKLLRETRRPWNLAASHPSAPSGLICEDSPDRPPELPSCRLPVLFMSQLQEEPGGFRIHQIDPVGKRGLLREKFSLLRPNQDPCGQVGILPDDGAAGAATRPSAFIIKGQRKSEPAAFADRKAETGKIACAEILHPHSLPEKVRLVKRFRHRMNADGSESGIADLLQLSCDPRFRQIRVPEPENRRVLTRPFHDTLLFKLFRKFFLHPYPCSIFI